MPTVIPVSEQQKHPESLESLAQKLDLTQETLKQVQLEVEWQNIRGMLAGCVLVAASLIVAFAGGSTLEVATPFWIGFLKLLSR
jgi:alcohol dehydrogenase class IV